MFVSRSSIEPAWLTIDEAKRYVGCGRTSLYVAINAGRLEARAAFGRTLVSRASIDAYLASAPRIGVMPTPNSAAAS